MTTNIDRAAEALADWALPGVPPEVVAQALADAGLLMPDLPKPDREGYWWPEHGRSYGHVRIGSVRSDNDRVVISRGDPDVASRYTSMTLTKNEALELASILTAAADCAERNQA